MMRAAKAATSELETRVDYPQVPISVIQEIASEYGTTLTVLKNHQSREVSRRLKQKVDSFKKQERHKMQQLFEELKENDQFRSITMHYASAFGVDNEVILSVINDKLV